MNETVSRVTELSERAMERERERERESFKRDRGIETDAGLLGEVVSILSGVLFWCSSGALLTANRRYSTHENSI